MSPAAVRTIQFSGDRSYSLDEHGFLYPPNQWDEAFAEGMAREQGIAAGLTDEHWTFIRYLRRKFIDEHTVPLLVLACHENKLRLGKLKHLFPTGYHRGACRIAGINYDFMRAVNIWHTYELPPVQGAKVRLTPLGFLEQFDDWRESFAADLAREWAFPDGLTDRHLQVIRWLRDYYRDHHKVPSVYETCDRHALSLDELHTLFPAGYRRGACRMAGLPFLG